MIILANPVNSVFHNFQYRKGLHLLFVVSSKVILVIFVLVSCGDRILPRPCGNMTDPNRQAAYCQLSYFSLSYTIGSLATGAMTSANDSENYRID